MKNITIRDSGNKEVLEAYFLNHEGQPYNLENKTVTFMENKDGDKFVSDPNVQIVNATAGFVRYTLQSQVHSAPGIAWFEINDDSGLVDSTGNFNIRVENGLRATADNTTYIAALEKLKQQMEALIQQADGELKTELQRAEQQLNQELQNFRTQYNSLSADFQNQFKTAQNARQQDYNNQKNAINQDWTNNKNSIWEQWNNDKANIDKQAQDTVQAIKDNAKQVLDRDQADWNAKQTQWDSTFSAIVKEWQVKTNSLNATVQDLTNKFNTIIGQVSDLMNNKLPTIHAKADAIQEQVNAFRSSLSQIDWNSFAKKNDLSKIKFVKDSLNQNGDSFQDIQFVTQEADGTFKINTYDSDWTANKVSWLLKNTQSYNIEANTDLNHVKAPGLYHCSGESNIVNVPGGEDNYFNMVVNSDNWNGSQAFYATDSNQLYIRTWNNSGFKQWRRVINEGDLNRSLLPLSGGIMNKGAFINWNGSDSNSAKDGHLGGIQWTGATDSIQIYGDNNAADNLDLAIQLGDDNSNRISIRDKDGTERAAITSSGYFTGSTNWARVGGTGISNPTLGRYISQSNTWNDIIGQDNGGNALAAIRDQSNGQGNTIGNYSSGIVFGGGDTKGMLNVAYDSPRARIIGGNGNAPVWKKDIAWKDDLKVNVVRSYDIEKNQPRPATSEDLGIPWLVDQVTLAAFADAHRDVRNHTDYRYPTDIASDTAINLNSDPYLDTGIYKISNCAVINGPWAAVDARRWLFLQVAKFDDNSIYQTINCGYGELYSRCVSKTNNSYPQWSKFATMDSITDLSDRLHSFTMQQDMFQHRVDYDNPSGTISNQTVDFNNYRETGILKVVNCLIQNGPYKSDNRHTVFLKITNLDGQTQYQTVYEGDNLYGRKLYNGSGQWHKYTNTPI